MKTGDWALDALRAYRDQFADLGEPVTYRELRHLFAEISGQPNLPLRDRIVESTLLLFRAFGWPIVVGSFFYAIPLGVLSYPFTSIALRAYRRRLADVEGLSYEAWNRKHVESPASAAAAGAPAAPGSPVAQPNGSVPSGPIPPVNGPPAGPVP